MGLGSWGLGLRLLGKRVQKGSIRASGGGSVTVLGIRSSGPCGAYRVHSRVKGRGE